MHRIPLILASTSPWRRALMERVYPHFETCAPGVDESLWKSRGLAVSELALELSKAKARAIAEERKQGLVIGSDQCGDLSGRLLDKPLSVENAVSQLKAMQGRSHRLHTGLCIVNAATGEEKSLVHTTTLRMRSLSEEQIRSYVSRDEPLQCCGSYKIESLGIALFESIEGNDPSAIEGLPMMSVVKLLDEMGYPSL